MNETKLRAALIEARDWFESQAKAVSKGCGSSYELHDLRVQRDALDAALAAPTQPVAWMAHYKNAAGEDQIYTTSIYALAVENDAKGAPVPLYAAPQPAAKAHECGNCFEGKSDMDHDCRKCGENDGGVSLDYKHERINYDHACWRPARSKPPAQALDALKKAGAIAVSAAKTNSRDIADWREDMDRIAAIAAQQGEKT